MSVNERTFDREYTDAGAQPSYTPPPTTESSDWTKIGDLVGDVTGYVLASASSVEGGSVGDLNGTYQATDVQAGVVVLAQPENENADWNNLVGETAYISPTLSTEGEGWVGPFVADLDADTLVANIIAPQGMYYVTEKGDDKPWFAEAIFEVTPVDNDGNATGATLTSTLTVSGDGADKAPKGDTLEIPLPAAGRYKIRCRRTSGSVSNGSFAQATRSLYGIKEEDEGTIVDELKWRDLYATRLIEDNDFGDVTTVRSRTYGTSQATGRKELKLTCRAQRKILERNPDDTFGPNLVATSDAANILFHIALDPFIGGRPIEELDVPQIYQRLAEVREYFGFNEAGDFNYTFDQANTSFEEMARVVSKAVFCEPYRQGNLLRLFFERETEDATILFNHRNKVPRSEERSLQFGRFNDHDGVELDFVDPEDGVKKTVYRPTDRSAARPKKVDLVGVQDERAANIHADRVWGRIQYQHTAVRFDALQEASQLVRTERIQVADNTRPDVSDGYITAQDSLTLFLSQPFTPEADVAYTIHLQNGAGGLDVIDIADEEAGVSRDTVTLLAPPTFTLSLDPNAAVQTAYQIVGDSAGQSSAFIVVEKGSFNKTSLTLEAINYDSRYYSGDKAYLEEV